jgi:DNA-binding MarR family transcriptional regulator
MVSQSELYGKPDLAVLLVGANRFVTERLAAAVVGAGIDGMRTPYGFVIRALDAEPLTLTGLADRLAVTKQAAIKVVDEMERAGFLRRAAHPHDRRAKVLVLTDRGREVRRAARAESERMEAELREDVGDADVDALRRALLAFAQRHGGLDDALAARARPVW